MSENKVSENIDESLEPSGGNDGGGNDEGLLCSSSALSDILGITRRHLYNLSSAGILEKPDVRDNWEIGKNVRAFLKYRELIGANTKERSEILKRKDLAEARLKELTFKIKAAEYISLEEVRSELENMAATLSNKMQSIPELLAQRFALDEDLKNVLGELIERALKELKDPEITKKESVNIQEYEVDGLDTSL